MKILMLGVFDCAGTMLRWKQVLGDEMDYYVEAEHSLNYENLSVSKAEIKRSLPTADFIFYHCAIKDGAKAEHPIDDTYLGSIDMQPYKDKTFIFLNGSYNLRIFDHEYQEMFKGYRGIVATTPDLCMMFNAKYMPVPLDLSFMPLGKSKQGSPILCTQFPTNRAIKNTDEFLEVSRYITDCYHGFRGEIKGSMANSDCIDYKFNFADMGFDHMQGYFGVNSLEFAWAGKPCMASLWNEYMPFFQQFAGTWTLPFVNVHTSTELKDALAWFMTNPKYIKAEGQRARRWMETHWLAKHHKANLERILE